MKAIKKFLAGTAVAASVMAGASSANALEVFDNIDSALLALAGSEFFGATFVDESGAFMHEFTFEILADSSANSSVTTQLLAGNDIDFTSIFLDGFAFTQTGFDGSGAENWELASTKILAGVHTIRVSGSVVGASGDGSYSGVLNVAAVPEPATWALMIMGFGGAGAMIRRRRQVAVAA